jgi:hypothetical protein
MAEANKKEKVEIKGQEPEKTLQERQQEFLNELVPFMAFKDSGKYKDDLVIIVNGKTWQIQRGVQVMIPRYVYLAHRQAEKQKTAAARHNQALIDQYRTRESGLL